MRPQEMKGKKECNSTRAGAAVLAALVFALFAAAQPAIAGTVTYDYDDAGRLVKGDYGDGTAIEYEYDNAGNLLEREIIGERPVFFDTGPGTYPSISGTHEGTITPNQTITVSKLYTYPCSGTGGHSEHVRIWNDTWAGMEASLDRLSRRLAQRYFPRIIHIGSKRNLQLHHSHWLVSADSSYTCVANSTSGWINCTKFVDANGKVYYNWILAIRLFL